MLTEAIIFGSQVCGIYMGPEVTLVKPANQPRSTLQ
jgi:hypothetical protein